MYGMWLPWQQRPFRALCKQLRWSCDWEWHQLHTDLGKWGEEMGEGGHGDLANYIFTYHQISIVGINEWQWRCNSSAVGKNVKSSDWRKQMPFLILHWRCDTYWYPNTQVKAPDPAHNQISWIWWVGAGNSQTVPHGGSPKAGLRTTISRFHTVQDSTLLLCGLRRRTLVDQTIYVTNPMESSWDRYNERKKKPIKVVIKNRRDSTQHWETFFVYINLNEVFEEPL